MLSFFPRCVLDEILNLIESVSEGFPSYSNCVYPIIIRDPPIESAIHKSALNLFMNIVREKESVEYKIAERQLAMKNINEKAGLII